MPEASIFQKHSKSQASGLWWFTAGLFLLSLAASIWLEKSWILGIPFAWIFTYATILNIKIPFYILLATIPLSTETSFENGFSTDLPAEPLTVYLMFIYFAYVLQQMRTMSSRFFLHPISLLLLGHVVWIGISCINSYNQLVSIKFFLAKIWYVVVFYFLSGLILKDLKEIKKYTWFILIPLITVAIIVVIRHGMVGFSFKEISHIYYPFFRNHVDYACQLALFIPFVYVARSWYNKWSNKWLFLWFAVVFSFLAIQVSYTRAAIGALFIGIGAFYVMKYKLLKPVLVLAAVGVTLFLASMASGNKYLRFAPNFEKTVTHQNFENLLEATYKLQDISTMERVYRWVAASQMIKKEPWFGFGPGTFYFFYKSYTVSSFKTYVSYNPEKSGIHCYYLMTQVEQGIFGLIILLSLISFALMRLQYLYHTVEDKALKKVVGAILVSFVIILCLLVMNDMIETIKVGPFYFIILALITNIDLMVRSEKESSVTPQTTPAG